MTSNKVAGGSWFSMSDSKRSTMTGIGTEAHIKEEI